MNSIVPIFDAKYELVEHKGSILADDGSRCMFYVDGDAKVILISSQVPRENRDHVVALATMQAAEIERYGTLRFPKHVTLVGAWNPADEWSRKTDRNPLAPRL